MNPLTRLVPALYASLNSLVYIGEPVPVYQFPPGAVPDAFYVLLQKPRIESAAVGRGCQQWECSMIVHVVARFAQINNVSAVPADEICDYVLTLLEGQPLAPADTAWQVMPGQLVVADDEGEATDGQVAQVHRRLTLRWHVYYHGGAGGGPVAPRPTLALPAPAYTYPFVRQTVLVIAHNLGRYPMADITDLSGEIIEGDPVNLDLNTIRIQFSQPLSGTVVLR